MEREKRAEVIMRAVFSKKCFHDIYTFYLHYFMFLRITFEHSKLTITFEN